MAEQSLHRVHCVHVPWRTSDAEEVAAVAAAAESFGELQGGWSSQYCWSASLPMQPLPPNAGWGLPHVLLLRCVLRLAEASSKLNKMQRAIPAIRQSCSSVG